MNRFHHPGPIYTRDNFIQQGGFPNMPYYRPPRQFNNKRFQNNWSQSFDNSPTNNDEHYCEMCDKSFRSQNQLQVHNLQHQKCNIDGCQFVAHPKIITKHIQMQHSTGLYKKISKLDDPEEIKKWREERKKKYPTKESIERKNAEIKEKNERGERMGLYKTRNNYNQNRNGNRNFNERQPTKRRFNQYQKDQKFNNHTKQIQKPLKEAKQQPKTLAELLPSIDTNIKLKPFVGIQFLNMDDDVEDNTENIPKLDIDDEELIEKPITEKVHEPTVCGALSSLICDYGSSDDEEASSNVDTTNLILTDNAQSSHHSSMKVDEGKCNGLETIASNKQEVKANAVGVNEINISDTSECTVTPQNNLNKIIKPASADEDSAPEEVKTSKNSPEINNTQNNDNSNTNNKPKEKIIQKHKRTIRRHKAKLPSTLLEKLLYKDMCHERNVILQCVRYVVKNNYLDT